MDKSKNCFVISPIGAADTPQRKKADNVLNYIFRPALEPLGYTVTRADEISQPGSITLQVLERVLESELVIADLTDHNPNVFYELAVRHASQKPVIHVIASDQKIPFDVADLRTIPIDIDLEGADRARKHIVAQAKEIEAGNLGETPVKLAGVLKHLTGGKSDEKVILKQILDGITELRSDFRKDIPQLVASNAQMIGRIGEGLYSLRRSGQHFDQTTESLNALEKKLLVQKKINKKLRETGDTLASLEMSNTEINGDPYVRVAIRTKAGKSNTIYFLPDSPAERICDSLLADIDKPKNIS